MTGKIDARTEVYGVIGHPVKHSLSPIMHNAAFDAREINAVYLAFEIKEGELGRALSGAEALGIRGLNVTIPYKVEIMKYISRLDDTAASLGAVNTVSFRDGETIGYNTDCEGVIRSLRQVAEIKDAFCLVLGAGGAARAAVYGLKQEGARVVILNRSAEKAEALAKEFECEYAPLSRLTEYAPDILLNTTPVGMAPDHERSLVPPGWLKPSMVVMDAVYNPPETKLIKDARNAGCKVVTGLEWLIYQGAASFRIWRGIEPPVEIMRAACEKALRVRTP